MPATLAFDVYGTLIDTHGVVVKLEELVGSKAEAFSRIWREKQLEYSFRRGLMRRYENFAVCTHQALDFTCAQLDEPLSEEQKSVLMGEYGVLPAFDDAKESLLELKAAGHSLYAFSNGTAKAVEGLLVNAEIRNLFDGIVSVDDRQTFKPNPDVYRHFLSTTTSPANNAWLISSNPFDVIGAISTGMHTAWIKRSSNAIFDPWGMDPTLQLSSLRELEPGIAGVS